MKILDCKIHKYVWLVDLTTDKGEIRVIAEAEESQPYVYGQDVTVAITLECPPNYPAEEISASDKEQVRSVIMALMKSEGFSDHAAMALQAKAAAEGPFVFPKGIRGFLLKVHNWIWKTF